MGETVIVVLTALCSGLIATLVTILWQKKSGVKNEKIKIFTTLMSKRYDIAAEESVNALNMIDVVFYQSEKVRSAWKSFLETTNQPDSPTRSQAINDKHLKLLEVIAEDIGYEEIRWDDKPVQYSYENEYRIVWLLDNDVESDQYLVTSPEAAKVCRKIIFE